jgi:secreted Zn-dependent insulinase-like peptidase
MKRLDDNKEESEIPKLVFETDQMKVFHKKDDSFDSRLVFANHYIYSPQTLFDTSVEGKLFIELWLDVVYEAFQEFLYSSQYAKY